MLDGSTDFSPVVSKSEGCRWKISFEDDTGSTIIIPSSYSGTDICNYTSVTYETNDAIDIAVYNLLKAAINARRNKRLDK